MNWNIWFSLQCGLSWRNFMNWQAIWLVVILLVTLAMPYIWYALLTKNSNSWRITSNAFTASGCINFEMPHLGEKKKKRRSKVKVCNMGFLSPQIGSLQFSLLFRRFHSSLNCTTFPLSRTQFYLIWLTGSNENGIN